MSLHYRSTAIPALPVHNLSRLKRQGLAVSIIAHPRLRIDVVAEVDAACIPLCCCLLMTRFRLCAEWLHHFIGRFHQLRGSNPGPITEIEPLDAGPFALAPLTNLNDGANTINCIPGVNLADNQCSYLHHYCLHILSRGPAPEIVFQG